VTRRRDDNSFSTMFTCMATFFCIAASTSISGCHDDADGHNQASAGANTEPAGQSPKTGSTPPSTFGAPSAGTPDAQASPGAAVPMPAKNAGYTLMTYRPKLALRPGDKTAGNAGQLYVWNFFGESVSSKTVTINADGSITLLGGGFANGQISSATSVHNNEQRFVGTAFGGGAYFEAVFKFEGWHGQSATPQTLTTGFPAFWAMAIEHLNSSGADHWPGKAAGFLHFAEFDLFEYNVAHMEHTDYTYSGSVHDWYGEINRTCPVPTDTFCQVQNAMPAKMRDAPETFDFSQYHTYGALWVPATDTADGYLEWYLDDAPIGQKVSWPKLVNQESLATPGSHAFGIADLQHMALIFGTGREFPMTIKSVTVWQNSTKDNLVE
jgi:hypothetical protein